ncbi:hypothetical protein [Flavobacterium sp. GSB-24]|uniref:hypothetical protein n=1 Tax=Flavobacterium sp. GSB-24 TaxID=2994319 RepID=UPI002491D795|nr:hypothetical protein [Flavobacterium sp. GSB-24]BDU27697.1 hypothetical protein FLGSB24_44410 [Flavobacterium sp. GSB-24]
MNIEKFQEYWRKLRRRISNKWFHFVRFITLRSYFHDLLQTYVVEEIMKTSVTVRHIDNHKVVLDHYETTTIPIKGDFIMVGVFENKKYYKIKKVVYCNGMGAYIIVKDVKNLEKKKFLL